ncbi:response regulator transcription factor [Cellulomonas sp. APG4]|uniref:response regulator transcription factor n=1 Tax=Cellulomonas sp. APG4 TaxID=1538656 RepID=UPI00351B03E7
MTTILIAEDDALQAELVQRYLGREGFRTEVVGDGRAALRAVREGGADLVVLDVMLPGVDGFTVCRTLRASGDETPVLMLTARGDEDDLLTGLELGADDYLAKPYSPRELVARVRALLRRRRPATAPLVVGPVVIDPSRHETRVDGRLVELTHGELQLLTALAEHVGMVLTRAQLLRHLHGSEAYLTERTIDTHVKNLRAKIEREPRRPELLRTVYGVGYKMVEPPQGLTGAP